MKARTVFKAVSPYLGVLGVAALLAMLLGTIYFTWLDLQWTAFLAGILVAAILALVSRASRSEWILLRRTAQLAVLRDKFALEAAARGRAEERLASLSDAGREAGEQPPVMLARLDAGQRCRHHNRAFAQLAVSGARSVEGRPFDEILGATHYGAIADAVAHALAGRAARVERVQTMADGTAVPLLEQLLPATGRAGEAAGCWFVATVTGAAAPAGETTASADAAGRSLYAETIAQELTDWEDTAARLQGAIDRGEFTLYVQSVMPLAAASAAPPIYEILSRLQDEEDSLLPPGVFMPLAESHGLLPRLDRWVVRRLLAWASAEPRRGEALYSVNVSAATLGAPGFAAYVRERLAAAGLPGSLLCFEIAEADALGHPEAVGLILELRAAGCRIALCGVGRSVVPFELIRRLQVHFLKIDSRVIYNIVRDPVELAKARAIARAARAMSIGTIAELVESEDAIALLRAAGVDYAQGFAISRPRPLEDPGGARGPQ